MLKKILKYKNLKLTKTSWFIRVRKHAILKNWEYMKDEEINQLKEQRKLCIFHGIPFLSS